MSLLSAYPACMHLVTLAGVLVTLAGVGDPGSHALIPSPD